MIRYIMLAILGGAIVIVTSLASSSLIVRNRANQTSFVNRFTDITQDTPIRIESDHNNFNIILLSLKNPSLSFDGPVNFVLSSEPGDKIREIGITGFNIGDPSDVRLQFAPIPDSANQNYSLSIETQGNLQYGVTDEGVPAVRTFYRSTGFTNSFLLSSSLFIDRLINDILFVAVLVVTMLFTSWILSKTKLIG